MSGRKIVDKAEPLACLEAAAQSGLSRAEWGRSQGIDGRSLTAWANNLARGAAGNSRHRRPRRPCQQRLVELVPAAATGTTAPRIVVRFGAFAVEVSGAFDEASLRRLLGVLTAC
jgi:hypothetical protein